MPLWCAESGTLYWIDVIRPGRIFHWSRTTNTVDFWEFADLVTGVDLTSVGELLVRGTSEVFRLDPARSQRTTVFSMPSASTGMRFNDGHCDRAGRLWVGTMENNITKDGKPTRISRDIGEILTITETSSATLDVQLGCPNAICWSPDGATFYVADSCDGWLYAYDFELSTGQLSNRRRFSCLQGLGIPDGAAVDCEGYLWNARWGAGAVARISPDGQLDRVIRVPTSQPTACCFGDQDLRTLYVTSARFGLPGDKLKAEPHAGGVFAVRLPVAGLAQARFKVESKE